MSQYQTIAHDSLFETTIKKSRFITRLKRIQDEEEAKDFIERVRQEEKQATHNVFAYVLGEQDQIQRASDDGEPSQTAGFPALQALMQLEVHDVAVVITRYFGGIKLGASGLIRAYHGSVVDAINDVGRVARQAMTIQTITIAYPQLDLVEKNLSDNNITIQDRSFTEEVTLTVAVANNQISTVADAISELTRGQETITTVDESFVEVPLIADNQ